MNSHSMTIIIMLPFILYFYSLLYCMKHILHINGMHCKSCEMLIKQSLHEVKGCSVQSIFHKTGTCEIEYDQNEFSEIENTINNAGYTLWVENTKQPWTSDEWIEKIAWLLLAGVLIFVLMKTDVTGLIPKYDELSLWIALIIGLVASISTCLAVTGWIIIGYNESVQTHNPVRTQIKFHIGRIIAFILWWALLGLLGSSFGDSAWFNAIFSILVGIVLLYLGLQLLWIVPNITKRWFHLPSGLSQTMLNLKNPKYASIVWAMTFLLPCGFTQSMQLFALQSSSPVQGALIMWAFALGTLPVLFGIWMATKYIKDKVTLINPLIASLLVVFGMYTIYNGTQLTQALSTSDNDNHINIVAQNLETEMIQVGHDGTQFVPSSIKLAVGKNYKLIVNPTSDGIGCMYALAYQWKEYQIKKWETFELFVDGSKATKIPLVCTAMGMRQGEIVIQ